MREDDLVEWVDENDKVIEIVTRGRAHKEGLLHRVVAILIKNAEGEILLQQRRNCLFDISVAGHVDVGEEYQTAAYRELTEELGIRNSPLKSIGKFVVPKIDYKEFHTAHIFTLYLCDEPDEPIMPSPTEMLSVRWADPYGIMREMEQDIHHRRFSRSFKYSLPLIMKILSSNH